MSVDPTFDPSEYWERRLRDRFNVQGVGFLRLGRRYNRWMYRVRGEVFDRVVDARIPPSARDADLRVLDVGSGTGFYVDRWRRRGARVYGVDLADVAVKGLSASFPGSVFIRADIGLPLEGDLQELAGTIDVISAFDVFFHIVDDASYARALVSIGRLLKPGGWFFWSDNFLHGPTVRSPHHVSRSLSDATTALEQAGLTVVDRVPMFFLMNDPADARSRWPRMAWRAMVSPAIFSDRLGGVLGAGLYPIERQLVRRLHESPSTELMVCVKESA